MRYMRRMIANFRDKGAQRSGRAGGVGVCLATFGRRARKLRILDDAQRLADLAFRPPTASKR